MARDAEFVARITAEDDASKVIDTLAKKGDKLESGDTKIKVGADTKQAERDISGLMKKVDKLGNSAASTILLRSNAEEVAADMGGLIEKLDQLDAEDPEVDITIANINKLQGDLEQIGAKAEELSDTPIELDAKPAVAGLDQVNKSADSSKSVLANMVGNATQDLGALGGVAGSAGVAIGQMGEYMAEAAAAGEGIGSIVGNFAAVAGPIAALSVGIGLITKAFEEVKRNNEEIAKSSKEAASGIADSFREISSAADLGARGPIDFLEALSASFVTTQESSGLTLKAMATLGLEFDKLGETLRQLDSGDAGRFKFFEDFLANSDKVVGANKDIARVVGEAIVMGEDFDQIYRQAYSAGGVAAAEFVNENRAVIDALEQLDDAGENISLDEVMKQTTQELLRAQGGLEAFTRATNELGPDASKVEVLNKALEIYNSIPEAAKRWVDANKPLEDMPEQWEKAAEAAHHLQQGMELTGEETAAVTELTDAYGMTTDEVLSQGADMWDDNAAAAVEAAKATSEAKAKMDAYALAVRDASEQVADMDSGLSVIGQRKDALAQVFELDTGPRDARSNVRDIGLAIDELSEKAKGVKVGDVLANNVKADEFLDAIDSVAPQIQEAVTNVFGDAGPEAATALANSYIDQVSKELGGKFSRTEVAQMLGLDNIEATITAAVDASSAERARQKLEILTGLTGESVLTANLKVALEEGSLTPQQVEAFVNTSLAGQGVKVGVQPELTQADIDAMAAFAATNKLPLNTELLAPPPIDAAAVGAAVGAVPIQTELIPPEQTAIAALLGAGSGAAAVRVPVEADLAPAAGSIEDFIGGDWETKVTADADTANAEFALSTLVGTSRVALIMVSAPDIPAVASALNGLTQPRTAPINATLTNGSSVGRQLDDLARPRSASINVNVNQTTTLTRVDG